MKVYFYKTVSIVFIILCFLGFSSCDSEPTKEFNEFVDNVISTAEDNGILPERESESEKDTEIANARDSLKFKEHWVFYVDYSGSMVSKRHGNDAVLYKEKTQTLMAHVKEQLALAIPKIKTEGELSVDIVTFYDETLPMKNHNIRRLGSAFNGTDMKKVEDFIEAIEIKPGRYNTHHYLAVEDFINRCTSNEYKNWVNVMVLLTDGKDEAGETPGKHVKPGLIAMNGWRKDKEHKWYGVFVDLKGNINDGLASYFDDHKEKNLFKCDGLDFNFNFFNIKNKREISHRKDSVLFIPHSGNAPLTISFDSNVLKTDLSDGFYSYTLLQPVNKGDTAKYFAIKVRPLNEDVLLDDKTEIEIPLYYNWGNSKANNIPDRDILYLTIFDDKSPVIAINIQNGEQKIKYYNKWYFSLGEKHADTTKDIFIKYQLDKDAVKSPTPCRVEIRNVPNYMHLLDKNGNVLGNVIELDKKESGCVTLRVTVTPDILEGNYIDSLSLQVLDAAAYNTIIINGERTGKSAFANNVFVIKTVEQLHPITVYLFWLLLIVVALCLAYLTLIKAFRAVQPKFKEKWALQFSTEPEESNKNLCLDPGRASSVIFDNILSQYSKEYIHCIRYSVKVPVGDGIHKTWGGHNWWNIKLALSGDVHEFHMETNIFAKEIEMRPTYSGINVYVDGDLKTTISEFSRNMVIGQNNGIKLCVHAFKPINATIQRHIIHN